MRLPVILFFSSMLIFTCAESAVDKVKKQKQLTQLKSKIEKLRQTIEVKENNKSSTTRELRKIEKQIGDLSHKIRNSKLAIKNSHQELAHLKKTKISIQNDISRHNRQLSRQLYAAYTLGNQEQIKLLFSQENAKNLQRNLTYYEYFSKYRLHQIDISHKYYERLVDNENKTINTKKALEKTLSKQKTLKASLDADRVKRKKIMTQLEKELKTKGIYLSKLEDDAKNLKQLINSLSKILIETPTAKITDKFSALKGKLSWPVKGKVKKLFGHHKPPSNLRWQGVIINSRRGNNVRAISHGRIAFSDWLRGMGNLIIIDHGDGYLSLYGHNESLFKSTGEWVEAGDIIGSIGNSGGRSKDGLYFEIRKKGKPQNPSRWCKTSNWFRTI